MIFCLVYFLDLSEGPAALEREREREWFIQEGNLSVVSWSRSAVRERQKRETERDQGKKPVSSDATRARLYTEESTRHGSLPGTYHTWPILRGNFAP